MKKSISRGEFIKKASFGLFAGSALFAGCRDNDDLKEFSIQNSKALNQTLFANNVGGESLTFTTTGAWTSSVVETKSSATASWLNISPSSGNEAGTYTVNVNAAPNTTGAERKATIRITCKDESITITVTQRATTETGEAFKPEITLTTIGQGRIFMALGGTGLVIVNWGVGYEDTTYILPINEISQSFFTDGEITIKISGENITGLYCGLAPSQRLLTLDARTYPALRWLNCSNNRLTTLNVSGWLTSLNCSDNNQLTSLNVSGCTALQSLDVSNYRYNYSQLYTLDVSGLTALQELNVGVNQLTSLNVSGLTALSRLSVGTNHFTATALNNLFGTLHSNPPPQGYSNKTVYVGNNPGTNTADRSIATAKGWEVNG